MTIHICPTCKGEGCKQCTEGLVKRPLPSNRYPDLIYSGTLSPFPSRNANDQDAWMFIAEKEGQKVLLSILPGDHLTIEENGLVIFDGEIEIDTEAGRQPYPGNPIQSGQKALGFWIPWVQRGVPPEVWAGFFIREIPLLGVLTKNSDEAYL